MKYTIPKILIITISTLAMSVSFSLAWFIGTISFTFNATSSIVQSYFDLESGDGLSAAHPFIITKPIHFRNLSSLQNKGIFDDSTYYFQLGKLNKDNVNDLNYYTYSDIYASETSTTSLDNNFIDLSLNSNQTMPSIGNSTHTFNNVFNGKNILLKNVSIVSNSSINDNIGLFGYISDGAIIQNFNLENIKIDSSLTSPTTSQINIGLVVGYINLVDENIGIKVENIGISGAYIKGNNVSNSDYTFIGGGSSLALSYINDSYTTTVKDTGIMYPTDMLAKIKSEKVSTGTHEVYDNFVYHSSYDSYYNKANAWIGSNKKSFGIFNLSTSTTSSMTSVAFGSYEGYPSSHGYQMNLDLTSNFSSGVAYSSSIYDEATNGNVTQFIFGDNSENANKYLDTNLKQITSLEDCLYFGTAVNSSSIMNAIDYCNNNLTSSKYQNSLIFEIANSSGGDINFMSALPSSRLKYDSYRANNIIGLWKLNYDEGGNNATSDGTITAEPNVLNFKLQDSTKTAAQFPFYSQLSNGDFLFLYCFTFKLPKGRYLLGSVQNTIYFTYVSVSGQTGGDIGSDTSSFLIDYIKDSSTLVSNMASYHFSYVTFKFLITTFNATNEQFYILKISRTMDTNSNDLSDLVVFNCNIDSISSMISLDNKDEYQNNGQIKLDSTLSF